MDMYARLWPGGKTVAQEVRDYEILVKGKHAGSMKVVITDTDDGLTTVMTDAAVEFNVIVYTYRYEFHGNESWRGESPYFGR